VIRIHRAATVEATAAFWWYEKRSAATAERFWNRVKAAYQEILAAPQKWAADAEGIRSFRLKGFPYAIIYKVVAAEILVASVAHGKRRPRYWRTRWRDF